MSLTSVLVVGAGPTGLAVACGLRAAGVEVRVVDRAVGPAVTSRALGLMPRGVEVLARLGALGDLPARSLPVGQVVVSINGREVGRLPMGRPTRLVQRPGLLVSQAEIEAELRCRLAKLSGEASVQWGREVVDVDEDPGGVTVRLADGATLRTGWVVGCDGAHSAVRKAACIGFPGVALVERFLLADVKAELPLPRDTVAVWLRGQDMLGAFPLPGADLWRLMAPAPPTTAGDPAQDWAGDAVLDALTGLLTAHAGFPAGVVRGAQWTSSFRFHRRLADTYRQGRVLLAGDAAHIHSPFGGQGLNTGIGDAENLAWKLALVTEDRAGTALLDSYEAERRPVAAEVLASTSSMTRLVLGDTAVARLVRDRVFVPLLNRPWVQRRIWEQASQLTLSYRGGPLASPRRWSSSWQPGDRVPDLICRRQDGARTQLHAELGPRWALLAVPSPTARGCLQVARGWLGGDRVIPLTPDRQRPRTVLLVRPDAHLAWRGNTSEGLQRWLTGALDPRPATTPPPEPSRPAGGNHEATAR